jgi:hypothetical protein
MDNARVYAAEAAQEKLDVSRFKRMPQPPYNPDIASSDFFFSVVGEQDFGRFRTI